MNLPNSGPCASTACGSAKSPSLRVDSDARRPRCSIPFRPLVAGLWVINVFDTFRLGVIAFRVLGPGLRRSPADLEPEGRQVARREGKGFFDWRMLGLGRGAGGKAAKGISDR